MKHPVIIKVMQHLLALGLALSVSAPAAAGSTVPTDKYVAGQGARFESLAGSQENLVSLVNGLRTGSKVTLEGPVVTPLPGSPPPPPHTTRFTPPTKPMGYGNITRSLDLASRQLASVGITNPTPAQLKAALNGGTVLTANGYVKLDGVLQLRSQGMGWGKIAHTIGVHPSGHANAMAVTKHPHVGVTTAGSSTSTATAAGKGSARSSIVTAAGSSPVSTAGSSRGNGHAYGAASAGVKTAAGGSAGGGHGNGNAYGRAGK
jgi:hypothetical protein